MIKTPPIVVSGSIAVDRIMSFSGKYRELIQPDKLDSLSISVFIDDLKDADGGVGANIAYSLALLGEQPQLLGSVGKNALLYMEKLAKLGVNIQHVHESDLPTASFTVLTDGDQNQVAGFYPGAMFDSDSLSLEPWKDQNPIIIVAPHDPKAMKRQVAQCKQWGLRLCYDIGQQVSNLPGEDMAEGIRAAEVLILNDYELSVLSTKSGITIESIKETVPVVITTFGKDGSIIEGKSVPAPIKIGTVKPTKVADPTGAGDAFRAGFTYAYAREWSLRAAAQLGAVCATYAIEEVGTQSHTFTPTDIAKRYQSSFNTSIPDGVL